MTMIEVIGLAFALIKWLIDSACIKLACATSTKRTNVRMLLRIPKTKYNKTIFLFFQPPEGAEEEVSLKINSSTFKFYMS